MSPVEQEKMSDKNDQYEALRLLVTHIRHLRALKPHQDGKLSFGISLPVYEFILVSL